MTTMPLHVLVHPADLVIARLHEVPTWDWQGGAFAQLTVSADEVSVVTAADRVPPGTRVEGPFRAVEVAGPLAFSDVGAMHTLLTPLVEARISPLAMTTYDTDWVLVPAAEIEAAVETWRRAGLIVTPSVITGEAP